MEYKGETFTLKFCPKCRIFRSLRAHHCKICEVCVEEFDHHSQIVSNCIGKHNRKSFLLFLLFSMLTTLEILYINMYNLIDEDIREDKARIIYSLAFVIISSFLFFSVGMMLFLQTYLISIGLNTIEYFKGGLKKDRNPFDEGFCANWCKFFRKRRGNKNIDFTYFKSKEFEKKQTENSLEMNLQNFTVN